MTTVIFVVLIAAYIAVTVRVHTWETLCRLDLGMSVPQAFLTHPNLYHRTCIALFLLTATAYHFTPFGWSIGAPILFATWLGTGFLGNRAACNAFRTRWREMSEMFEEEGSTTGREIAKKSDEEILHDPRLIGYDAHWKWLQSRNRAA